MSWLNLLLSTPTHSFSESQDISFNRQSGDPNSASPAASPRSKLRNQALFPSMLDWFFAMTVSSDTTSTEDSEEDIEPDSVVIPPQHQELLDQYYQELFRADEFGFINSDSPHSKNKAFAAGSDIPCIRIDSPSPSFGFYVEMTPPTSPKRRIKLQEELNFAVSEEESAEIEIIAAMGDGVEVAGTLAPLASRGSKIATTTAAVAADDGEQEQILRWWDYFIL